MKTSLPSLKKKYTFFIISVAVIIIITQAVIQFDLRQQNSDARLINFAGKQRMLSQRIVKIALYIYSDFEVNLNSPVNFQDSIILFADQFEKAHRQLIEQNDATEKSAAISIQLTENTPNVNALVKSARAIAVTNDHLLVKKSLIEMSKIELVFLQKMEKTVSTYQAEAEEKLASIKSVELMLSGTAILILVLEFIYIFLPALTRVGSTNKKLFTLNRQLVESNNILAASEEEIKTNLEQISALKGNLELRERQYRELVEDASDVIYELDKNGRFSYVNEILERLTGFTKTEVIGTFYLDLIHPDDRSRIFEFYKSQRENKEETSYVEFRLMSKNETALWVGQNVKMFFDGHNILKVSAVARDITQLKIIRDKLVEKERLYRLLSENSSDIISIADGERKFKFISQSCTDVLGYTPEELLGKKTTEFIHPDDLAALNNSGILVREKGVNLKSLEFRIRHKQGHYIWVEAHAKPFADDKNSEKLVQTTFRDITNRKQTEEKLAKNEKLYRLLSENSRDVVSLHEPDGAFEYISPSCIELHGYTPEEMVGKLGTDFIHPDDIPEIINQATEIRSMMLNGLPIAPMQFRILSKNRGPIWAENMIKPIFSDGKLSGFQSTVRDISFRKKYEEDLKEAKEKAEYATNAKSQFLGMMSHEIRTPMNAIIGLTNLLLQNEKKTDRLEKLRLLKFSGENLLTIINDILDFTKIEADKIEIESVNFNLHSVISRILKMMEYRCTDKGLKLIYHYDEKLPLYLIGDPVRIGQIVTNLIGNAIKFTHYGEIKLLISEIQSVHDTIEIQFEVIDNGIGIPANKLETIFDRFSQAESTTTRKYGGTGLGLAITRKLVHKMNGEISVESKEGVGSRFSFKLNLKQGIRNDDAENESEINISPFIRKNIQILLAEDNALNQLVASEFLIQWGAEVTIANNGKEAIEIVKTKIFDVVLMDLQMPEINGYEAAKIIRSMNDEYYKTVPIIALTASAMIDMRDKVIATGMTDFLSKPFQPHELYRIVFKYIRESKRPDLPGKTQTLSANMNQITKGNKEVSLKLLNFAIQNMEELRDGFEKTNINKDPEIFNAVVHKCKMTISFLKDDSLNEILKRSKDAFEQINHLAIPSNLGAQLHHVIDSLIKKLKNESNQITQKPESNIASDSDIIPTH